MWSVLTKRTKKNSLAQWFNIQSVYQQIMYMFVIVIILVSVLALWLWYKRRKVWDKTDLIMVQLSNRLAKNDKSLARNDSEGVLNWLQRIRPQVNDEQSLTKIAEMYRKTRYGKNSDIDENNHTLKKLANAIKIRVTTE